MSGAGMEAAADLRRPESIPQSKWATVHYVLLMMGSLLPRSRMVHFCSTDTILEQCSVSRRTLFEAMKLAEEAGLILREQRRRANGSQTSTIYHLEFVKQSAMLAPGLCVEDDRPTTPCDAECNPRTPPSARAAPPDQVGLDIISLSRVRELAGDALASDATCPGIAILHPLKALLSGDNPCTADDVEAGIVAAAAWYRGKHGAGSMRSWDVARRMAAEARDQRLIGAPISTPAPGGATRDRPDSPTAKRTAREANMARALGAPHLAAPNGQGR